MFVVLVYVVIVLGGGMLIGHTASASVPLSVLATAVVALAFEPVQAKVEAFASRKVHGGVASPYDVLSRFSETVSGSYAAEELPSRMARLLAEGTGADWSQVWLVVGDRPRLAATWPPEATREPAAGDLRDTVEDEVAGRRSREVRHGSEVLGVLVVQEHENRPLTTVEDRLFSRCVVPSWRPGPTSCAGPASVSSTCKMKSVGCSSATSTTVPSSTWSRSP